MGPRFNGVEDQFSGLGLVAPLGASMGPRFNGVEDRRKAAMMVHFGTGFNGATL